MPRLLGSCEAALLFSVVKYDVFKNSNFQENKRRVFKFISNAKLCFILSCCLCELLQYNVITEFEKVPSFDLLVNSAKNNKVKQSELANFS